MGSINWKQGDSFIADEAGMMVADPDGTLTMIVNGAAVKAKLLDMTGWQVKSQVRRKDTDELVCELDFSWTNQVAGAYRLQAKDTTAWPLTQLAWDVQYTDPDGYVTSSETQYIRCTKDQTRAV